MKVLLNGATNGTNFGDFLFAEAFQNRVAEVVGIDNVYWYDSRYALSDFFKMHLHYNKKYNLKEIDVLICVSGGYFCGNDRRLKDYVIRFLSYFNICMQCFRRNIPVAIIGVEVGIPKNVFMKMIQKYILDRAKIVVVRNEESYKNLEKYGISKGICTTDSAHAIVSNLNLPQKKNSASKKLFFHIDQNYSDDMESLIMPVNMFLDAHPEYEVFIGTDQTCRDWSIVEGIAQKVKCDRKTVLRYDYPTNLCDILNEMDFIITPKLHVGIVGATLNKSVLSFSIHTEKIQRFYVQINESGRSVAINRITPQIAYSMMEKYHNIPINLDPEIVRTSNNNFCILTQFLSEVDVNR